MGTLSSLTGGGSGGGGGDPTGKFQASATVANGDLVVLNDNGTVAPVTSTAVAADFAKSDNGTKLFAAETSSQFGQTGHAGVYNQTHNKFLFWYRDSTGNVYGYVKSADYDASTGTFTNVSQRMQTSMYAAWLSQKRSPSEGYLLAYRGTNGYAYVRGFRWNGSNWSQTSEGTFGTSSISSSSMYISANGENSGTFAIGAYTNGELSLTHGSWDGSTTTPSSTQGTNGLYSERPSATASGSRGTSWGNNSLVGTHVKNDIHVIGGADGSVMKLIAAKVESSGTTYGTKYSTNYNHNGYPSRMIYDEVNNVGVIAFYSNSGSQGSRVYYHVFSVNHDTLDITNLGFVPMPSGFSGYSSGLGWNPFIRLWVAVDHLGGEIQYWKVASDGTISDTGTGQFAPNAPNTSSLKPQFNHMFPIHGTGGMGMTFNNDHVVGGSGAGSYMDATNQLFATRFDLPYVDTNVANYFGEAKEAISSGAAGSVAILTRTKDIADSSFQEGQKLFAKPSGTALATSGTYRVGHATDKDTVLVLGDPS